MAVKIFDLFRHSPIYSCFCATYKMVRPR